MWINTELDPDAVRRIALRLGTALRVGVLDEQWGSQGSELVRVRRAGTQEGVEGLIIEFDHFGASDAYFEWYTRALGEQWGAEDCDEVLPDTEPGGGAPPGESPAEGSAAGGAEPPRSGMAASAPSGAWRPARRRPAAAALPELQAGDLGDGEDEGDDDFAEDLFELDNCETAELLQVRVGARHPRQDEEAGPEVTAKGAQATLAVRAIEKVGPGRQPKERRSSVEMAAGSHGLAVPAGSAPEIIRDRGAHFSRDPMGALGDLDWAAKLVEAEGLGYNGREVASGEECIAICQNLVTTGIFEPIDDDAILSLSGGQVFAGRIAETDLGTRAPSSSWIKMAVPATPTRWLSAVSPFQHPRRRMSVGRGPRGVNFADGCERGRDRPPPLAPRVLAQARAQRRLDDSNSEAMEPGAARRPRLHWLSWALQELTVRKDIIGSSFIGNSFSAQFASCPFAPLSARAQSMPRPGVAPRLRAGSAPAALALGPAFGGAGVGDPDLVRLIAQPRAASRRGADVGAGPRAPFRAQARPRSRPQTRLRTRSIRRGFPWKEQGRIDELEVGAAVNAVKWRPRSIIRFRSRYLRQLDSSAAAGALAAGRPGAGRRVDRGAAAHFELARRPQGSPLTVKNILAAAPYVVPQFSGKLKLSWDLQTTRQKLEPSVRAMPLAPLLAAAFAGEFCWRAAPPRRRPASGWRLNLRRSSLRYFFATRAVVIALCVANLANGMVEVVALVGVAGSRLGIRSLDPLAAIGVAIMVFNMGLGISVDALGQLTDTTDEKLVGLVKQAARRVVGPARVLGARARAMGSSWLAEVEVAPDQFVASATAVDHLAAKVRVAVLDAVPTIDECTVNVRSSVDRSRILASLATPQDLDERVRATLAEMPEVEVVRTMAHFVNFEPSVDVWVKMRQGRTMDECHSTATRARTLLLDSVRDLSSAEFHLVL
ncbi:unnamed protein product [Prorocentrum cordatum]|uniref:Uncharacterized protein n=1 Tax=Prorocentrum cordatum TaxID=2364126 RepID=A0ABN9UUT1_9DINO|nr:unnamed protein product [Polarella glacialis]